MKSLTRYAIRIGAVLDSLDHIANELQCAADELNEYAEIHGRRMTCKEFDKWDDMNREAEAILEAIDDLSDALNRIEEFVEI